jgi:hypothetical protein
MAHTNRFSLPLALLMATSAAAIVAQPPVVRPAKVDQAAPAPVSRLVGDWRASAPVTLPAATPSLPQAVSDLGVAPAGARLERVMLLLEPSPAQRQALDAELQNQQTPGSPEYHHWLTPSAFADRYANSASDVAAVVAWLQAQGLQVAPLPMSRGWIEFSGTAAQIEPAFHTQIHSVVTPAGTRMVLAQSVAVPAALRPLIHGLASLDGAVSAAALTTPQPVAASPATLAAESSVAHAEALTPQLVAQLLHLDALHAAGTRGSAETIAIAARSNVQPQDVAAFRSTFSLPASPVSVVLNGSDPGLTGDQAEAVLTASWASVAAPDAQIVVVSAATTSATDGLDLSLAAVVDQSLAHTALVGYSACEAALSESHQAFYAALYRQAAAEGIAVIAAAGDSGPAACHAAGTDATVTTGYAVNALASTPWNTAVGASAFSSAGPTSGASALAGWSPLNSADAAYAGGGGSSTLYTAPVWQPLPSQNTAAASGGNSRLVPDVALPTALDAGVSRGLAFCLSDSAPANGCNIVRSGGSSAAAALFAGIAALVAEKNGPQGNLAPNLYALSRQAGIFDDVQQGSARLACAAGTPGCGASGQIGYSAAPGYDLATGLGSVNAQKLLSAWATPQANGAGAVSVTMTTVTQTINPSGSVDLAANVTSQTGGPAPTGTVIFFDQSNSAGVTTVALVPGTGETSTASATVTGVLIQGGHPIQANYSGDSVYAATNSLPVVINVDKSATTLVVTPATLTPAAGSTLTVTATISASNPGASAPSGTVNFTLDGVSQGYGKVIQGTPSTSSVSMAVPSAGSHTIQGIYSGDVNYDNATANGVTIVVSKGATVTALTVTPSILTPGIPETLTVAISPLSGASGTTYSITGTVNFYDGATLLGTSVVNANGASLANVTLSSATTHLITAVYSGDTSWATSTSNPVTLAAVLLADKVTLTVNPAAAAPGQVVTLIATVTPATTPATTTEQNPTGTVIFYNGTTILGSATLAPSLFNTSTATILNATLPAGEDVLTAVYVGDLFYATGTSNTVTISVEDFSILPSPTNPPTNLNIIKGSSGSASFIVTGLGGFNNIIQVVCAVPTQDDMTCIASPQQVTPPGTVTFTVQTYASGGTTASRDHAPLWPRAAGGTALAALLCFLLPMGRKARILTGKSTRRFVALLLLLVSLGAAGVGCGNSVTLPSNSGTPLGVATLTITAASYVNNTVVSHSVYLTVNVLPPGSTTAAQPKTNPK